jgi:Glycosyl transferase family 2
MKLRLLSHVNGDGDLLEAWFKYYLHLGVTSFHLVVHGPRDENARLFELKDSYPVNIEDSYEGVFDPGEKERRLNSLLPRIHEQWLMFVDSDEFVEFPYRRIPVTIRMLELAGANVLFAPMVQRLTLNGSLDTPEVIEDPFGTFPLCSFDLYQKMGVKASIRKYPLFYCTGRTLLANGGNHNPPIGDPAILSALQGVTHHFKFRRNVLRRLENRINSPHPWRQESVQYQKYLENNSYRLPTEDSFAYSRRALFRRRLLRRFTLGAGLGFLRRATGWKRKD